MSDLSVKSPGAVPGNPAKRSPNQANSTRGAGDFLLQILHRVAVIATLALLVAAAGLMTMRLVYSNKVMPSVYVADVNVGGMTRDEATAALQARADTLLAQTVVFDYDGRQWTTSLADLGVQPSVDGLVDSAFAVGREDSAGDRIGSALHLTRNDEVIPLTLSVNSATLSTWMDQVTTDIGSKPRNAKIVISDNAEVTVKDDVDGIVVDETRMLAIIKQSISSMTPYRGQLPVTYKPADIHVADVQDDVAMLTEALSAPVTVVYKKKEWTIEPNDLVPFIVQEKRTDRPGYDISLDDAALGRWILEVVGDRINRDPVNAVIAWDFDKSRVQAIEDSSIGVKVLAGPLADSIAISVFGEHGDVEVPVKSIQPEIDDDHLDALGITKEIARGDSSFYGSGPERSTNIHVGTGYLNGTIVRPGEEFSFNNAIGDITAEAGYVEAAVVDGERIGKDVGGGICQVSTTVFRAAFYAGFPITEWWPHLYRLNFYELDGWTAGLDASILQEGPREDWGDFRFQNITDSYLLIEAYVTGETDVVVIYGPETNWDVFVSEPWEGAPRLGEDQDDVEIVDPELPEGTINHTELMQDGLEISYERIVTDANDEVISDRIFYSLFQARGNVYKVSPDMKGESPAQTAKERKEGG